MIEAARDLLSWCLEPDPQRRPQSMFQVLSHKFLKPSGGLLAASGAAEVDIKFTDITIDMKDPKSVLVRAEPLGRKCLSCKALRGTLGSGSAPRM